MTTEPSLPTPQEIMLAYQEAQTAGIRPKEGRPDVPLGPVLTNYRLIPMRDPRMPGSPAIVTIRFSTPIGPMHFLWPIDVIRRMSKELDETANAAELLPDPAMVSPPGSDAVPNGKGGLILPGNN